MHFHPCRFERTLSPYSEAWFVLDAEPYGLTESAAEVVAQGDEQVYAPVAGVDVQWLVTGPCDCTPPTEEELAALAAAAAAEEEAAELADSESVN
jgi:hypothetical protein